MLTWIVMYNIFKADKLKILSVVVARQEGGMNEACSPRRQISSQKGKSVAWQKQYSIVLDDDRLLVLVECKMCQVKICSLSNTSPFSYLFPPSPSMLEASTNDNRPHAYNVTEQIVPPPPLISGSAYHGSLHQIADLCTDWVCSNLIMFLCVVCFIVLSPEWHHLASMHKVYR